MPQLCTPEKIKKLLEKVEKEIALVEDVIEGLYGYLVTEDPDILSAYTGNGIEELVEKLENILGECFDLPKADNMDARAARLMLALEAASFIDLIGVDGLPRFARVVEKK